MILDIVSVLELSQLINKKNDDVSIPLMEGREQRQY